MKRRIWKQNPSIEQTKNPTDLDNMQYDGIKSLDIDLSPHGAIVLVTQD